MEIADAVQALTLEIGDADHALTLEIGDADQALTLEIGDSDHTLPVEIGEADQTDESWKPMARRTHCLFFVCFSFRVFCCLAFSAGIFCISVKLVPLQTVLTIKRLA